MSTTRIMTLCLTPALVATTAVGRCDFDRVPTPNPSDFINVFTEADASGESLYALLMARDSFSEPGVPRVLRRGAGDWTDLGAPPDGPDGPPVYFALFADDEDGAWLGGVSEDDRALQALPVVARYDSGWSAPQEIDMINQPDYPFYDRGGEIYAFDTAPDGTMFAVGVAKNYGRSDDNSVPLFFVNDGFGWDEVTRLNTDWPGSFSSNTYLNDVIAFSSDNVWAVGWHSEEDDVHPIGGLIVHWNGSSLSIVEDPRQGGAFLQHPFEAMAANGPDDIWAVGGYVFDPQTSTIAHFDGKAWTRVESPIDHPLRSIVLDDDGTGWAASATTGSDIARFDGTQWLAVLPVRTDESIGAMTIDADGATWMLGATEDRQSLALRSDCACPGDVDSDGNVGVPDLLAVLAGWGPCSGCPGDVDGDGEVGLADVLEVLATWGPCELRP